MLLLATKLKDYKLVTWDPIGPQIRVIGYNKNQSKFNVLSIWLEQYGIPWHNRLGIYNTLQYLTCRYIFIIQINKSQHSVGRCARKFVGTLKTICRMELQNGGMKFEIALENGHKGTISEVRTQEFIERI